MKRIICRVFFCTGCDGGFSVYWHVYGINRGIIYVLVHVTSFCTLKGTVSKVFFTVHWCFIHVCFVQVTMCGAPGPRCAHFSIRFTPSWNTQQILIEKGTHRGASACRERQRMFKIVTWTKQTWIIHQGSFFTSFFTKQLLQVLIEMS